MIKKVIGLLFFLILVCPVGFAQIDEDIQRASISSFSFSQKIMKKLAKIENLRQKQLKIAQREINKRHWKLNIPHDELREYANKRLAKIDKKYNKALDKIFSAQEKTDYLKYISRI